MSNIQQSSLPEATLATHDTYMLAINAVIESIACGKIKNPKVTSAILNLNFNKLVSAVVGHYRATFSQIYANNEIVPSDKFEQLKSAVRKYIEDKRNEFFTPESNSVLRKDRVWDRIRGVHDKTVMTRREYTLGKTAKEQFEATVAHLKHLMGIQTRKLDWYRLSDTREIDREAKIESKIREFKKEIFQVETEYQLLCDAAAKAANDAKAKK